jgi:hypothetical protein
LLNIENDYWKLIRIGKSSVGLEIFGVCASISSPLIKANIDEYYISSYHTGYCFIPSEKLNFAKELFLKQQAIVVCNLPSSETPHRIEGNEEIFEMNDHLHALNNSSNNNNNIIDNGIEFCQTYLSNLKLNTSKTNN